MGDGCRVPGAEQASRPFYGVLRSPRTGRETRPTRGPVPLEYGLFGGHWRDYRHSCRWLRGGAFRGLERQLLS